jgi:ABC-type Na+ efflux pump permease subunit
MLWRLSDLCAPAPVPGIGIVLVLLLLLSVCTGSVEELQQFLSPFLDLFVFFALLSLHLNFSSADGTVPSTFAIPLQELGKQVKC